MPQLLHTIIPRRRGANLIKLIVITALIYFIVDFGFRQDSSEEKYEKWSLDRKPKDKFNEFKKSDDDDMKEQFNSEDRIIMDEFLNHLAANALKTRRPYVPTTKKLEEIRPEVVQIEAIDEDGEIKIEEDDKVLENKGKAVEPEVTNVNAAEKQGDEGVEPQGVIDEPDDGNGNIFGVENPGEMGKPVTMPAKLSPEVKKLYDEGWKRNSFNQYLSDHISVHRSLVDFRTDYCKAMMSNYSRNLPATSVIIIFHNEAWSTLLRSVHSVIDRSPEHLLTEIILVDDFSDMGLLTNF